MKKLRGQRKLKLRKKTVRMLTTNLHRVRGGIVTGSEEPCVEAYEPPRINTAGNHCVPEVTESG